MRSPYFIADIGMNHGGSVETAKGLIDSLISIDCDAVKFQSWTKDSLYAKWAFPPELEHLPFSEKDYRTLRRYCRGRIDFSSSVFSEEEVDFFSALRIPWIKVASMDLNNTLFLKYIAQTGKPIILSTGMGTLGEIENAVTAITEEGSDQITLMHCVSLYPPPDSAVNLRNIPMLRQAFGFPVGFSDHTQGSEASLGALALGATVIEKHYPCQEMEDIIRGGRRIKNQLGSTRRTLTADELEKRKEFRRGMVFARDMKRGEVVTKEDIAFKRPETWVRPDEYEYILGRRLLFSTKKDDIVLFEDF